MPWLIFLGAAAGSNLLAYMKGKYDAYANPDDTGILSAVVAAPTSTKSFSTFNLVMFAIVGAVGVGLLREVRGLWGK